MARTLEVVGERWTMLVLREAFWGTKRFEEMQRNLGVARNVLADRLQTLVGAGIMERKRYQERPERFEYRLTEKGLDLYPALIALMSWGDKYMAPEAGPPVVLEHKKCEHETSPVLSCSECGEELGARDMRAKLTRDNRGEPGSTAAG